MSVSPARGEGQWFRNHQRLLIEARLNRLSAHANHYVQPSCHRRKYNRRLEDGCKCLALGWMQSAGSGAVYGLNGCLVLTGLIDSFWTV